MKKLICIFAIALFTGCTGNTQQESESSKKKIYRLVGVNKDSSRVILGRFK